MAKPLVAALREFISEIPAAAKRQMLTRLSQGAKPSFKVEWPTAEPQQTPHRRELEVRTGSGIGALISLEEGRRRLATYGTAPPLETWAGPVAGAGEIESELGVPRSTLNEWYKAGAIVGLPAGIRKRVYPLGQFVDARPLEGIRDVARMAPDARSAWLWLCQPHGRFDGMSPLQALQAGQRFAVMEAAEFDFVRS